MADYDLHIELAPPKFFTFRPTNYLWEIEFWQIAGIIVCLKTYA